MAQVQAALEAVFHRLTGAETSLTTHENRLTEAEAELTRVEEDLTLQVLSLGDRIRQLEDAGGRIPGIMNAFMTKTDMQHYMKYMDERQQTLEAVLNHVPSRKDLEDHGYLSWGEMDDG